MKPITCKHCGAVEKHHSFQCYTQLKPIKRSDPAKPVLIEAKTKPAKKKITNLFNMNQPKLLKLAEQAVNACIRERDWKGDHFVCISCNKRKGRDQMNAGHFYSVGGHSYLRFNEDNINGQCIACNCHLSGNLLPYRQNLIKKIGQERVDELEKWNKYSKSWDKLELVAIIQLYRGKLKAFL